MIKKTKKLNSNNLEAKPAIVNNNTWPAVILAAKRIAKLNTRIMYENISITNNIGNKNTGTSGKKNFTKPKPFSIKPNDKAVHHITIEKNKENTIWAVGEKLKGTKPNKLQINMKRKSNKKKG